MTRSARPPVTIGALMDAARLRLADAREAPVLLAHLLGCPRATLYAHPERPVAGPLARAALELIERRRCGEPVAYLVGEREFFGLSLAVGPAVLVPRPETELLVELALECLKEVPEPRIADLGTGSGAIAIALARSRPDARIVATDLTAGALRLAAANLRAHDASRVHLVQADWLDGFSRNVFDLIVANPPYVAETDPALRAGDLRAEPRKALAGGRDGLASIRAILAGAPAHLRPGGWLVLEHGAAQGGDVIALAGRAGFIDATGYRDLAGLPRAIAARLPGGPRG